MGSAVHQRFRYKVDSGDRIRFVDANWLNFARENGAAGLSEAAVVDRPLWDFIAGKETRHLYRLIFEAVREERKTRSVPFRCDSPECRRFMKISISPLPSDGLEFAVSLINEERRANVALLDQNVARRRDFITVCSWCKRVLLTDGYWVEVEIAIRHLNLFAAKSLPQISHGICNKCASAMDFEA